MDPRITELWDEWATEMERSRFSVIAGKLITEEYPKARTKKELREYVRRFRKHIRASNKHVRAAKRIRRQIKRLEKRNERCESSSAC